MQFALLSSLLAPALGDFYLQWPRGSNNRMDGESRDRRNGRRLFDSQNNGRGGYNRGTGRFYWYEGSEVPFVWTQDQSCADDEARCTYVIQYYCHEHLRDGWYTDSTGYETIPYPSQEDCRVDMRRTGWEHGNCTYDYRYGMQETRDFYTQCTRTSRNKGLFTGDQNLRGNGAHYTRQNPSGTRHGYECSEERDYYPYWNPSPWRDLAILTDEPSRCQAFQDASQNVKERYQCIYSKEMHEYAASRRWNGYIPVTQTECVAPAPDKVVYDADGRELNLGSWERVDSHGIAPPLCMTPNHERSNTLSNSYVDFGHETGFNWTIPDWFVAQYANEIDAERCVIRIRTNHSSHDPGFTDHGYKSPTSIESGMADHTMNAVDDEGKPDNSLPTQIPVWERWGFTKADVAEAFSKTDRDNDNFGRGYTFGSNPQVDIFGPLLPASTAPVYLNLAINTAKWPRVHQDRTHGFVVRKRPAELEGYEIINLSVKGKRGNIVQTWPAHEYDFQPSPLQVKSGSLLHIQWNGANTNPRNNAGEGPQGYDRSNIVVLGQQVYPEAPKMDIATGFTEPMLTYGQLGRSYPQHFGYNPENPNSQKTMERQEHGQFLGWAWKDLYVLSTPPLYGGYFDFGIQWVTAAVPTTYNYLATRNNNFSNRSQKGTVTVRPRNEAVDGPELPMPKLKSREAKLTLPGVAYIQYDRDERLRWQQSMEITQGPTEKGYDSPWIKVWPRVVSMPDMMGMIQLNVYHDWKPFHFGRIYWAEYPGDTQIEMTTETDDFSWGSSGRASAWVNQGGYFVVKNTVNMTAVGGAVCFAVVFAILCFVVYKKFGCRFVGGKAFTGARDPLMAQAPRSDAPAAAAAPVAAVPAETMSTSGETA